jgi:hypothetical protein
MMVFKSHQQSYLQAPELPAPGPPDGPGPAMPADGPGPGLTVDGPGPGLTPGVAIPHTPVDSVDSD